MPAPYMTRATLGEMRLWSQACLCTPATSPRDAPNVYLTRPHAPPLQGTFNGAERSTIGASFFTHKMLVHAPPPTLPPCCPPDGPALLKRRTEPLHRAIKALPALKPPHSGHRAPFRSPPAVPSCASSSPQDDR